MRKVLIANRGEIAVRVVRACRDHGLASVAIYAEPDLDAMHVTLADEAYALGGTTPGESYLRIDKVIDACRKSGADAVHPGYGFLSENGEFAQAVVDAGLTWIGPTPDAIRRLGDKVEARHIALAVGAPLVPGTTDPVSGADEVVTFAEEHGLPVAIKAAFGGGGRGLKVARTIEEIPELFASAVREAEAAFGRGECFVERYLDRPRHVEVQVLGDTYGTVVVVGDRDCSLQRRHQKLVEEAPAPHLTDEQRRAMHDAARAICEKAGYVSAGTVEFLVGQDGTVSFLEVNTRLQVEHPVTELVTGLDLVREQFRIADGARLEYGTPEPRGHAFEFRINGEDPGRGFLPAPGTVTRWTPPEGPGIRLDSGVATGSVIGQSFDSLLAKLIVYGATRAEALERSRRALDEFVVEGLATALPFHRAVVGDPAFAESFDVHTRWIETEFANDIAPYAGGTAAEPDAGPRESVVVEVGGKRLEVVLPAGLGATAATAGSGKAAAPRRDNRGKAGAAVGGDALTSPMQGTIVKVNVAEGDTVAAGDLVVVLEAMKMEQPLNAHKAGTVTKLTATVGEVVTSGAVICEIT
ncbi:MAG TPA: biotin carboxylase N-terminal domain-containing protein [Frankiaceae bacterium]|nr:biotin carboxylase N-terminal domain-containing protein [Frankiaceae bacterium]